MYLKCLYPSTETDHYLPIHREAPAFVEQATEQQILVTGIKVPNIPGQFTYSSIKPFFPRLDGYNCNELKLILVTYLFV